MTESPNLNESANALIEALEGMERIAIFREALRQQTEFWSVFANPEDPNHRDALDLLAAWRALDDLAAAVQARKEA